MDKQENGDIKEIMLEEYLDNLKTGEKVLVCKLENGNLNVVKCDELLDKINRLIEYNSYDECGEFNDNNIWNMKLD